MKIVTFTRDMRPWQKGQDAVLPDDIARKVLASGEAENPRPFPPQDVAPAGAVPPTRGRGYSTRKRG